MLSELKITTNLSNAGTGVLIKDISDYAGDRAKYVLVSFVSGDGFVSDAVQDFYNFMASEWNVAVNLPGINKIKVYAVPIWSNASPYAKDAIVFNPELDENNNAVLKVWKSLTADNSATPSEGASWTELSAAITPMTNYASFSAAANLSVATSVESVPLIGFSIRKTDEYKYELNSTGTSGNVAVFAFGDYIVNQDPIITGQVDITSAFNFTVPGDGIYIVAISNDGTSYKYEVIYAFDSLMKISKALLKCIFCPENLHDCPVEQLVQIKENRLFITKAATGMATVIGIIHSEQVDHFHYFSMTETRLAALQRANDILQRVLVLSGSYVVEIPCNCHQS